MVVGNRSQLWLPSAKDSALGSYGMVHRLEKEAEQPGLERTGMGSSSRDLKSRK